jgi:two-component system, OmpR family, sensor histidine kinase BaeS
VLANLVGNSIKHAAGAAITLEARGDDDGVELTVGDSGPGIAAEALPHVFDRFWQGRSRRRGGAGLGLTIARGIVLAHGGDIAVASEVGQGTRFTVRLPRPAK